VSRIGPLARLPSLGRPWPFLTLGLFKMVAKIQSSPENTVKNRRGREEQAFSADGGKTWEVNWNTHTRIKDESDESN
jgi:hypothetical protein